MDGRKFEVIEGGKEPRDLEFIRRRTAQILAEIRRDPQTWKARFDELDAGNARVRAAQQARPGSKPRKTRNTVEDDQI